MCPTLQHARTAQAMSRCLFTGDYGNYKGNQIKSLSSKQPKAIRPFQGRSDGRYRNAPQTTILGELQLLLLFGDAKRDHCLHISRQRHGIGIHEAAALQAVFHGWHFHVRPSLNLISRHNASVVVEKQKRKKDDFHKA